MPSPEWFQEQHARLAAMETRGPVKIRQEYGPPPNEDDFCAGCGQLKSHHGLMRQSRGCPLRHGSKYEAPAR